MFNRVTRYISLVAIAVGTSFLAVGVILFQAAFITKADSDYTIPVTWLSALSSVIWPPSRLPFLSLFGIFVSAGFTAFIFFRASRILGVTVFFLQVVIGYVIGGWLGWFFICRELGHYHFSMDGEKLGEHWFIYESLAVWTLAAAVLGFLRIFAQKHPPETRVHEPILVA